MIRKVRELPLLRFDFEKVSSANSTRNSGGCLVASSVYEFAYAIASTFFRHSFEKSDGEEWRSYSSGSTALSLDKVLLRAACSNIASRSGGNCKTARSKFARECFSLAEKVRQGNNPMISRIDSFFHRDEVSRGGTMMNNITTESKRAEGYKPLYTGEDTTY
jgi:triphosphoribosyl-dephospho-CoA synthetase